MKVKKRRKSSRFRGSHTHGRGFKKKARGSGHRGGVGMAGSGKRGDQRKTLVLNLYGNDYFGKDKALRKKPKIKYKSINLRDIVQRHSSKETIKLKGYKVLGEGEVNVKLTIVASAASQSAIDKVKKAGGDIIIEK
jgi:large subunit ribosomal protein L15